MTDLKCFNKIGFAREYNEQNKETLKEKEKGSTYPD